jgi:hypothetical protein
MDCQDWNPVTIGKKVNQENKKQENKKNIPGNSHLKKLLDDDIHKINYVDKELSQQIIQARLAKKMNRKQLANAMMITESIVADYETGKAVHNGQIVNRFKTFLGINKNTIK